MRKVTGTHWSPRGKGDMPITLTKRQWHVLKQLEDGVSTTSIADLRGSFYRSDTLHSHIFALRRKGCILPGQPGKKGSIKILVPTADATIVEHPPTFHQLYCNMRYKEKPNRWLDFGCRRIRCVAAATCGGRVPVLYGAANARTISRMLDSGEILWLIADARLRRIGFEQEWFVVAWDGTNAWVGDWNNSLGTGRIYDPKLRVSKSTATKFQVAVDRYLVSIAS